MVYVTLSQALAPATRAAEAAMMEAVRILDWLLVYLVEDLMWWMEMEMEMEG